MSYYVASYHIIVQVCMYILKLLTVEPLYCKKNTSIIKTLVSVPHATFVYLTTHEDTSLFRTLQSGSTVSVLVLPFSYCTVIVETCTFRLQLVDPTGEIIYVHVYRTT